MKVDGIGIRMYVRQLIGFVYDSPGQTTLCTLHIS